MLVTGGVGYIGSHTVVELLQCGAEVAVVDDLSNSNLQCLRRVEEITGSSVRFHQVDLRDAKRLESEVFAASPAFDAVIHFAGLKAVGQSVQQPLLYYDVNLYGAVTLLRLMSQYGCRNLVFSSSATVYGLVKSNPITETAALSTTNPYGSTKLAIETLLRELHTSAADSAQPWRIAILRYFNPIGAHASGRIGEDPRGIPNNLLPFVLQTAVGRRDHVTVFGGDWPTRDGTGVRDYIHVVDLAVGHLAALSESIWADGTGPGGCCEAYNLGTGKGVSVLEIIAAVEKASGRSIKREIGPRRAGDVAECYADPGKAAKELKWRTVYSLEEAVRDSWRWQEGNPNGFTDAK